MGRNAERIRELMKEIQARVDATMPTAADQIQQGSKRAKQGKGDDPKSERRRKSRDREQ